MPYHYLDKVATADVAFMAWDHDLSAVFKAAADALLGIWVDDANTVKPRVARTARFTDEALDLLLYQFLSKMVYFKDAEYVLLKADTLTITHTEEAFCLDVQWKGEPIDEDRHRLRLDVKAITMHQLRVEQVDDYWQATVIVDV
jgi:SHS2 domain-containing protein